MQIIDLLQELKAKNVIVDYKIAMDNENKVCNVYVSPVCPISHMDVNVVIEKKE